MQMASPPNFTGAHPPTSTIRRFRAQLSRRPRKRPAAGVYQTGIGVRTSAESGNHRCDADDAIAHDPKQCRPRRSSPQSGVRIRPIAVLHRSNSARQLSFCSRGRLLGPAESDRAVSVGDRRLSDGRFASPRRCNRRIARHSRSALPASVFVLLSPFGADQALEEYRWLVAMTRIAGVELLPGLVLSPLSAARSWVKLFDKGSGIESQDLDGQYVLTPAQEKAPGLPGPATSCDTPTTLASVIAMSAANTCSVSRGVEHPAQPTGKTPNSQPRGAQNGALPARGQSDAEMSAQGSAHGQAQIDVGLITVIQAWLHLPEAIKRGILAMVRTAT